MKRNSELRREARFALDGNWGTFALGTLMYVLLVTLLSLPVNLWCNIQAIAGGSNASAYSAIGNIWQIVVAVVSCPLMWSIMIALLRLHRREFNRDLAITDFFDGFRFTNSVMWTYIVQQFVVLMCIAPVSLLLFFVKTLPATAVALITVSVMIVVAIYVQLRTLLMPFLLYDRGITGIDALCESWRMMNGYVWKAFLLQLSFIGWILLAIATLGIGFFWLEPYMMASIAAFYDDLRRELHGAAVEGTVLPE